VKEALKGVGALKVQLMFENLYPFFRELISLASS
jgi:hypothetical protein